MLIITYSDQPLSLLVCSGPICIGVHYFKCMEICLERIELYRKRDGVMVGRTDTANSDGRGWGGGVRVRECERVRAYVRACVRDVFAIYDNDILPMLIMIIIKIIILYFIQIRH